MKYKAKRVRWVHEWWELQHFDDIVGIIIYTLVTFAFAASFFLGKSKNIEFQRNDLLELGL